MFAYPSFGKVATVALTLVWAAPGLAQMAEAPGNAVGFAIPAAPDVIAEVGAGVKVGPGYYGSDEFAVSPTGSVSLKYLNIPGFGEFGNSTGGRASGISVGGAFRVIGERSAGDYDELEGLDDVDLSVEAGLGVSYEQPSYRLYAKARYGVIGHHSWTGDVGVEGVAAPADGLTISAGPRVSFGADRFMDTYFGVSPEEAAGSSFEAFDANGGVVSAGVVVRAEYRLSRDWGVEGTATYDRLLNDAADSPITDAGSENQYSVSLGVTRRISLDF